MLLSDHKQWMISKQPINQGTGHDLICYVCWYKKGSIDCLAHAGIGCMAIIKKQVTKGDIDIACQ